ncbi:MAG: SPFH domain-containing protein, partial [Eggerthellaceae bacterium]|nr:SPFH domain-containing protein [Eggerthellaceae bacterium]
YCDALEADVLAARGQKRITGRSSNTRSNDNIISDGSIIAINEGQCMIIVESGAIVDVCAEPGEFVYDTGTEPSMLYGDLGEGVKQSFLQFAKRFTFGGDPGKDQRIYYFNTKEIVGNKYGTPSPIPFRTVDPSSGFDGEIMIRCNGEYSYQLVDPVKFYKRVCGNVETVYTRDKIDSQLKSELLTALQPAFGRLNDLGLRYSALPSHVRELTQALNAELSQDWAERGIAVASFGMNSVAPTEEYQQLLKEFQTAAVYSNPNLAAGSLVGARSDAMRTAAANEGGAMTGFMGMGMANSMGGNEAALFGMGQQQQAPQPAAYAQPAPVAAPAPTAAPTSAAGGWTCSCGQQNTGAFCQNCGSPKPAPAPATSEWTCACGQVNSGKFCQNCGSPKPSPDWTCSCGQVNTGNFCQNCGSRRP